MLKLLDKLINERGSAQIMKERLGLKDDEMSALQRELNSIITENVNFKLENEQLKESINLAQEEIQRLNEIISSNDEASSLQELDEIKKRIIKLFFDSNNPFSISNLAKQLDISESLTEYHIDALKELKLVSYGPMRINSPGTFKINEQGRKFYVEKIGI